MSTEQRVQKICITFERDMCPYGAVFLAERIRSSLGERRVRVGHGRSISVTASFGVAAQHAGEDADLLVLSDAALYRAKRRGKNRVVA